MVHVCPWWIGYLLVSPFRRALQNPEKILSPYVREGMTVLEPGCGMGFFTLDLARLVGTSGKVHVVDMQEKMLSRLRKRAVKAGVSERIESRLVKPNGMGVEDLSGRVDFVLAFAMVHELPDAALFFRECAAALKSGGSLLLSEPAGHVTETEFDTMLSKAEAAGFTVDNRPVIRRSLSAVLIKK